MAQLVRKHVEKLDRLENIVKNDAENILDSINLDELLKDPEGYMLSLGDAFLNEHLNEIEQGKKEGIKFAKSILKKI